MSKETLSETNSFPYKTKQNLPILEKIKVEWDLKKHYYSSENDPQIEKDACTYEKRVHLFCKKYKNGNFVTSAVKLKQALIDNESLIEMPESSRIIRYFSFRTTINVNDTVANKKLSLFAERFRKLSNETLFFPLTIGKINKKTQLEYLKSESLKKYHYYLKSSFDEAKHHLSEAEERILNLRSNTSNEMWADAVEKIISNRTIVYKNKTYTLPEAMEQIDLLSWSEKTDLWNKILDQLVQISEFAEHELTAIVLHKKVSDELRSYKKPYSATVKAYENDEKAIEALVQAISTKGFALSQKFYKLKAKLHNKKSIPYVNKYDPIGKLPNPDFKTSVQICRDAFYSLDSAYGTIFDKMLEDGRIDVYPKAGKRGGAFMSATIGLPTYVMLNHKPHMKSLETMAHEIGHAIHAELSKEQSAIYEDFSTTTAETASTLFEQFVSEAILSQLTEKQKIIFLHDKLTRDIATVQRQIACFNFELEMHTHIREQGLATKEELATMMRKHLKSYLGSAVDVTDKDGYSYVSWHHLRYGFYVFTYAYGHLISNLLIQKYNSDKTFLTNINKFLQAGGSDTVENIFSKIGINTKKIETFTESLKTQENEIALLEKLTKK
jgi:oligoendopeptidase F